MISSVNLKERWRQWSLIHSTGTQLIKLAIIGVMTYGTIALLPASPPWQQFIVAVTPQTQSTVVIAARSVYLADLLAFLIALVVVNVVVSPIQNRIKRFATLIMASIALVGGSMTIHNTLLTTNLVAQQREARTGDHIITLSKTCAFCKANHPAVRELQYIWNATNPKSPIIFTEYDDDTLLINSIKGEMSGRGQSIAVGETTILTESYTVSDQNQNPVNLPRRAVLSTAINNTTASIEKSAVRHIWNIWERGSRHIQGEN